MSRDELLKHHIMHVSPLWLVEKALQQIIQKAPAQRRSLYAGLVQVQQSSVGRILKKRLLFFPVKPGPLCKKIFFESSLETQRVEQEFESQCGSGQRWSGVGHGARGNGLQVLTRMPRAAPSVDCVFNRQLAVRTCPNADVVAELPVVEVVPAVGPRPGKGRALVLL